MAHPRPVLAPQLQEARVNLAASYLGLELR